MYENASLGRHAQLFSLLRYNDLAERPQTRLAEEMVRKVDQFRAQKAEKSASAQQDDERPLRAV